jgi:hypothetical protein
MRGFIVLVLLCSAPAVADDGISASTSVEARPSRHLFYVEALGKGGLYGVGYEYSATPWLSIGGAASFSQIRDAQTFTVSPYLHFTALQGKRHALFAEVGAILAHERVPSPVMDWDGMSDTGGGGFASLGWEYRRGHFVFRMSGGVVAGEGGLAPMLGISIGARP